MACISFYDLSLPSPHVSIFSHPLQLHIWTAYCILCHSSTGIYILGLPCVTFPSIIVFNNLSCLRMCPIHFDLLIEMCFIWLFSFILKNSYFIRYLECCFNNFLYFFFLPISSFLWYFLNRATDPVNAGNIHASMALFPTFFLSTQLFFLSLWFSACFYLFHGSLCVSSMEALSVFSGMFVTDLFISFSKPS